MDWIVLRKIIMSPMNFIDITLVAVLNAGLTFWFIFFMKKIFF